MKNTFSLFKILVISIATLSVMTIIIASPKVEPMIIGGSDIIPSTTLPNSWSRFPLAQINDGVTSDAFPYNGFVSSRQTGTITFDLVDIYNITSFRLWNDINVSREGIKDFRLDFFDSSNVLISGVSFSNTAAVGQTDLQEFYFYEVKGVSRVNLVVLNTHPRTYNRIEIREVEFTGTPVTVFEQTSILGIAVVLGLGLFFIGNQKF